MAIINHTRIPTGNTRAVVVAWLALANGDSGDPIDFSQYADKSIQVTGAFGDGALVLEGSNDGATNRVAATYSGGARDITSIDPT